MNYIKESLSQVFGNKPYRPAKSEQSEAVLKIYQEKKGALTKADLEAVEHRHLGMLGGKWKKRRWITLILANMLFVVSYVFDVQLLEGALTASRFVGFHMADLNSALQVMLAYKHVVLNLLIGTVTVFIMWLLLGGRTFCSWACPYHVEMDVTKWSSSNPSQR